MPSWAFGIPFVILSSCFVCASVHYSSSSIHMFIFSAAFKWRMSKMESGKMTTDLPCQCLCLLLWVPRSCAVEIFFLVSLWRISTFKITSWKNYLTLSALSLSVQGAPPILCGGTCSIGGAIVQCLRRSCFVTALKRRRRQCCHMCCSALCGSLPLLFLQHHLPFFCCSSCSSFSTLYVRACSSACPAASYKPRSLV